jgi:phosphoenolpyruvate carboxylase
VPAFARALVAGRAASFAEPAPLVAELGALAKVAPDDETRETLLVMRSSLEAHGLSLADTHVRLNAVQLHNAIRRQVGLGASPNDPTNRRTLFNAINDLIAKVEPVEINFGSLMDERASAKRLMMTVAEIRKHVDARSPVRFLIAETESAFTLLTALYYARLFGVEDHVEISPLFETADALDRGERVIEEALKSPHYVAYLKRIGRVAMQFGYSDSGRFIGQMAATFRIERLRLRIAQLLERHGLGDLDVVLFNTHGESIGRGGHPVTMADRLAYLAPPMSRWEFARRGIRTKEEVSFQGGDGYLWFFTRPAALASLRRCLEFAFEQQPAPEAQDDPIYGAADFASEFFAAVQQEFAGLVDDADYVALLDLFGANLLSRTGSRPQLRQSASHAAPALTRVGELRAIPNNARLQQLAVLANTLYGLGRAAAKDKENFRTMCRTSPRFRRALHFVLCARKLSALNATRAYLDIMDPGLWLARAGAARSESEAAAMRELRDVSETIHLQPRLERIWRELRADDILLGQVLPEQPQSGRRGRVLLLHALRAGLIQHVCVLAMRIPDFSPQHGTTLHEIRIRLMRLEIPETIEQLREIFPRRENDALADADFGEASTYRPDATLSYVVEHEAVFRPLLELHGLIQRISAAITHECGAVG